MQIFANLMTMTVTIINKASPVKARADIPYMYISLYKNAVIHRVTYCISLGNRKSAAQFTRNSSLFKPTLFCLRLFSTLPTHKYICSNLVSLLCCLFTTVIFNVYFIHLECSFRCLSNWAPASLPIGAELVLLLLCVSVAAVKFNFVTKERSLMHM